MYHPTEMANALTPTSWFYSLYTHTSSNQNHRDYPSRLEISFLLDSGASIVADINYNILGTPFFEENIQKYKYTRLYFTI